MTNGLLVKFLRFWFPVILYSGIIFYVSSIPNVTTPLQKIYFDKILHVLEYLPFGFLVARGIHGTKLSISGRMLVIGVGMATIMFGASDEYHQSFVAGRNSGIPDLIGDTIGGVVGGYIYLKYFIKKRQY